MASSIPLELKLCQTCKLPQLLREFYPDRRKTSTDGLRPVCKLCAKDAARKYNAAHKAERNRYRKFSPRGRFNSYKNDAKHSQIDFLLSFKEFMTLWQKPCNYCNSEIQTIGVDRINSNGPYQLDNVTPCCGTCNFMKKDMTTAEFIEHCRRVLDHSARHLS